MMLAGSYSDFSISCGRFSFPRNTASQALLQRPPSPLFIRLLPINRYFSYLSFDSNTSQKSDRWCSWSSPWSTMQILCQSSSIVVGSFWPAFNAALPTFDHDTTFSVKCMHALFMPLSCYTKILETSNVYEVFKCVVVNSVWFTFRLCVLGSGWRSSSSIRWGHSLPTTNTRSTFNETYHSHNYCQNVTISLQPSTQWIMCTLNSLYKCYLILMWA